MRKVKFRQLPLLVRVAVGLTFLNGWVLFEETVVDRHGLWHYMPFYRVGLFCAWDVLALFAVAAGWWLASRARGRGACFLTRCALCRR